MKMKRAPQPKKVSSALGKVANGQVSKRREKVSLGSKKESILNMAMESLGTPEKKKVAKSLKQKKPVSDDGASKKGKKMVKSLTTPEKKQGVKLSKQKKPSPDAGTAKKASLVGKKEKALDTPIKKKVAKSPKQKTSDVSDAGSAKKVSARGKKQSVFNEATESVVTPKKKKVAKSPTQKKLAGTAKQGNGIVSQPRTEVTRSKPSKTMKKTVDTSSSSLNYELLKGVCGSTLKMLSTSQEEKKDLFDSVPEPILLLLNVFKVPNTPPRKLRCVLPNSIHPIEPDVCLIVPDIVRGRMRDTTFAKYVEQYEDKLREMGVTGIKQIIPFAQLRAEYSQYELKNRLSRLYDVFLCDGRVQGHCTHFLGAALNKVKKSLTPVHAMKMSGKDFIFNPSLQEEVDNAVSKVTFELHTRGTDTAVTVGHSGLSEEQLAQNIVAFWKLLEKELPGGITNIRSAHLKGCKSMSVPLYASLAPIDEVPVVQRKVIGEPVEDELSTVPGYRVVVRPDGSIHLKNHQTAEDAQFMKDGSINTSKRARAIQNKENAKRLKMEEVSAKNDDEDEDEQDVNAAELEYLSQWNESNDVEDEDQDAPKTNVKNTKKKRKAKSIPKSGGKQAVKIGISQKLNKVAPQKNQKKTKSTKNASKGKSTKNASKGKSTKTASKGKSKKV